MQRLSSVRPTNARGFTLLEFLIVFATFIVLMAGVFSQINKFQQADNAEETKVDASQQSRTMLDEIARELHQSGYPGQSLFDPNALANAATPINNAKVAAGLVKISNYELWFEGDVDGDGAVDVVHYMLMDSNGNAVTGASTCPCTLQRSQVPKVNAAPLAQNTTYASSLANILNSGSGNPLAGLTISGTTNGQSNNTLYAAYKNQAVFMPLNASGNAITALPLDITNPTALATVKSIVITVNTLTLNSDLQTKMPIPFTNTVTAKLNN